MWARRLSKEVREGKNYKNAMVHVISHRKEAWLKSGKFLPNGEKKRRQKITNSKGGALE